MTDKERRTSFFFKSEVVVALEEAKSLIFSFYYPKWRCVRTKSAAFFLAKALVLVFSEMNEEKYTDALHLHLLKLSSQNLLGSSRGDVCTLPL